MAAPIRQACLFYGKCVSMSSNPTPGDSGVESAGSAGAAGSADRSSETRQRPAGLVRLPTDEQPTVISGRAEVSPDLPLAWTRPREIGPRLVGQTLGHFQLEAFVGGGGMGAVFRARDRSLDRTVAVKVLSPQQLDDSLKRFRNEAQSAARLDHPNIARVYYVGEDGGWNYIVFEYIEGINVRDLVARDGPLPIQDAMSYTLQVADALDHAYRRDVIHRDIKPSNILITAEGEAKLVDMGLARLHQVDAAKEDLTASGITLGTFDYISPEQARDPRNTDVRSDLYSLGCTLYYMLTGRPPFPEGTVLQKLLSHSSDPPPDPRQFRPELPQPLIAVLSRLLAKRPEQRFQHPKELIAALVDIARRLALPMPRPHRASWVASDEAARPAIPRWLPWSAAAVAIVAVAVAVQVFLSRGVPSAPIPPLLSARYEAAASGREAVRPDETTEATPAPSVTDQADAEGAGSTGEAGDGERADREPDRPSTGESPPPNDGSDAADSKSRVPEPMRAETADSDRPPIAAAPTVPQRDAVEPTAARRVVTAPEEGRGDRTPSQQFHDILRDVARESEIEEIVLDVDGIIDLTPPQGDWMLDGGRSVTVKAAPGRTVTLRVRPARSDPLAGDHPAMLALGEGRWSFESIHWRFELPEDIPERRGWSLFALTPTSEVEFQQCTMTLVNRDAKGETRHPGVSIFRIGSPRVDFMPDSDAAPRRDAGGPQIWLEGCVVRGEGNFLSLVEAQPVLCYWKHGVLAISGRMLDIVGAGRNMEWQQGRVECTMEEVLLFVPQGLVRTRQSDMQAFLPEIALSCKRCIIATAAGDPPVAVIEQRGVDADAWRPPQIAGQQNRYRNTDVLLRVYGRDGSVDPREYSMSQLRLQPMPWYQEIDAGPLARFPWKTDGRPRSLLRAADFIGDEAQRRLLEVLGWDVESLPSFPEFPPSAEPDGEGPWKEPTKATTAAP